MEVRCFTKKHITILSLNDANTQFTVPPLHPIYAFTPRLYLIPDSHPYITGAVYDSAEWFIPQV